MAAQFSVTFAGCKVACKFISIFVFNVSHSFTLFFAGATHTSPITSGNVKK